MPTSETQIASQELVQQKGSAVQIVETQLGSTGGSSHPGTSNGPALQTGWPHAPALSAHVKLPQKVRTSVMHWASQPVLQQKESMLQIAAVHPSQPASSGGP